MKRNPIYTVVALAVLFLTVVPVGVAVFVLGFIYGDSPCVMCWEQRIGMALIALTGLFVLRYGPRPRYIGLAVLIGAWGVHMGVRHASLHVARDIGQGFSLEILGAHTYTWSAFIFWVCVVTMGALLVWLRDGEAARAERNFGRLESATAAAFLFVIAGNIVQAFASTGPPPYMGQSDPVRFSFNPKHWVWSLEEWDTRTPITWRGRWAVDKPSVDGLPADAAGGPIASLPSLAVERQPDLGLPVRGTITDLAYHPETGRFLITTQQGLYITDGAFSRIIVGTVVDPGFAVDLASLGGGAFLDGRTIVGVSENKSYVVLRETDRPDVARNFRYFLERFDQLDHVSRGRFATVRARLNYVLSAAYDPAADSLLTVSLPNPRNRRLIVSRFDRKDMTLSAEFAPKLAPDSGLALGDKRTLEEYAVTGAAVAGGVLYALSAAHSTILAIDLASQRVTAAWAVPGLDRPTGMAVRGSQFVIVNAAGARWAVER